MLLLAYMLCMLADCHYRIANAGLGNKVVLRGYSREPTIAEDPEGNTISISAGAPCTDSSVSVEKKTFTVEQEENEKLMVGDGPSFVRQVWHSMSMAVDRLFQGKSNTKEEEW